MVYREKALGLEDTAAVSHSDRRKSELYEGAADTWLTSISKKESRYQEGFKNALMDYAFAFSSAENVHDKDTMDRIKAKMNSLKNKMSESNSQLKNAKAQFKKTKFIRDDDPAIRDVLELEEEIVRKKGIASQADLQKLSNLYGRAGNKYRDKGEFKKAEEAYGLGQYYATQEHGKKDFVEKLDELHSEMASKASSFYVKKDLSSKVLGYLSVASLLFSLLTISLKSTGFAISNALSYSSNWISTSLFILGVLFILLSIMMRRKK